MVKRGIFWVNAKYIVSIISPIFTIIRYGDANAPDLGEVYECIDNMLGQMKVVVQTKDPTLQFHNKHIWPIIQQRWKKLNTPLHNVAYALNRK